MPNSLNIAFFVSSDKQSGTYFRYHNLAVGLKSRGHNVTVYSQAISKRYRHLCEERNGIRYILQPSFPGDQYIDFTLNPGNILGRFAADFRQLHAPPYDVYHLFQPFENAAWQWQWHRRRYSRRCLDRNRPLFAYDWDDLWDGGLVSTKKLRFRDKIRYKHLGYMERKLPRAADLVTTCSSYLADLATQRGASQVEILHNGIWIDDEDADDFPAHADACALRESFGLAPKALYLGFIGWTFTEAHWCLDVLKALKSEPTTSREVRLACAGYDLRQQLGSEEKHLAENIDYLGNLPSGQAHRLMRSLDVGLLPFADIPFNRSRLPIKFAEYLAAGLPALCGDVGEIGLLGRQLDGVVLLPPDHENWVQGSVCAIRDMMHTGVSLRPNKKQLRARLGWPVLSARLESIYLARLHAGTGSAIPDISECFHP